jgi:hypothetical protein
VQPSAPLDFRLQADSALPLVGIAREPGHEAHAWCGRVCVPKFLHKQFKKALGGPVTKRAQRCRDFYAETLAAIPSARPVEPEPEKFWRPAFRARFCQAQPARHVSRDPRAGRTSVDWWEECKAVHGGTCTKRWDHDSRMREAG